MKNKLKFLLIALILPCALVFSACGGQLDTAAKANIGSDKKYEETTTLDAFGEYAETALTSEDFEFAGLRATIKLNSEDFKGTINVLVSAAEVEADAADTAAYGMTYNVAAKANITVSGTKINAEIYLKDGVLYVNVLSDIKYEGTTFVTSGKYYLDMGTAMQGAMGIIGQYSPVEIDPTSMDDFNVEGLVEMIGSYIGADAEIKTYVEGDYTRFRVKTQVDLSNDQDLATSATAEITEELADVTAYFVFYKDMPASVQVNVSTDDMSATVTVELTTDTVTYPTNLETYEVFSLGA